MSKTMQNLVFFMESSENAHRTPMKAGNMILNRFCIDEDAAFELSGVHYLKKSSDDIYRKNLLAMLKRKIKGKEYKFPYYTVLSYSDDFELRHFKFFI